MSLIYNKIDLTTIQVFFSIVFLLLSMNVVSVGQSISEMKKDLKDKSGVEFVELSIKLTDQLLEKGQYDQARSYAEEARKVALDLLNTELIALCINWEAKALIDDNSIKLFAKAKATKLLRESTALSTDKDLQLQNLLMLKKLAQARGREMEVREINQQITALQEGKTTDVTLGAKGVLGKRKQEALDLIKDAQKDKDSLNQELEQMEDQRERLAKKSQSLVGVLREREAEFNKLSEEQMKIKYRMLQQNFLLDSMAHVSSMDSLLLANQEIKNAELEAQVNFQQSQRNLFLALAGIIALLAFGLYSRYRNIKQHNAVLEEKNRIIEEERKNSEKLFLNILPKVVADELKIKGSASAEKYEKATVLFADFKGFSSIAKELKPEKLVEDLDYCFGAFDEIVERHGLEKIKTIGDAYVCAGGMPRGSKSNAIDVVEAALEMQHFLDDMRKSKKNGNVTPFHARIGIHTEPLVAGVVGKKKFAYDIWGDTVNLAARLESNSEPGRINISSTTFQLVKDKYACSPRGKIEAKNIGEVDMYYINPN